jgi:hypothetical protein
MGSEPLTLAVSGWTFEVKVNDHWAQFAIVTDDDPKVTHYVRLSHKQAHELREYLDHNLPIAHD